MSYKSVKMTRSGISNAHNLISKFLKSPSPRNYGCTKHISALRRYNNRNVCKKGSNKNLGYRIVLRFFLANGHDHDKVAQCEDFTTPWCPLSHSVPFRPSLPRRKV